MFPLPTFIFSKKMYSQNGETDVLEVLEIIFFFDAQPWWTDLCIFFFSSILHFGHDISVIFLKIKRIQNLYIFVSNIITYSQNLVKEIRNCKKEQYATKAFANCTACLNQLPIILLSFTNIEKSNQFMLPK